MQYFATLKKSVHHTTLLCDVHFDKCCTILHFIFFRSMSKGSPLVSLPYLKHPGTGLWPVVKEFGPNPRCGFLNPLLITHLYQAGGILERRIEVKIK